MSSTVPRTREARLSSMSAAARKTFPHAAVAPFVLAAGTDARWLCDVCPCTLRFAPIDIDNQQFNSVHSVDENIDLAAIGEAIEFYKEVIGNYK